MSEPTTDAPAPRTADELATLRAQLDEARGHVSALLSALDTTTEYVFDCACDHCRAIDAAASAARAFLREA